MDENNHNSNLYHITNYILEIYGLKVQSLEIFFLFQ